MGKTTKKCSICDNDVGESDPFGKWCDEHHRKFCNAWDSGDIKEKLDELRIRSVENAKVHHDG